MFTVPSDRVLVIGAGSGAEVVSALECGLNPTALEKEARQYRAVCQPVLQFDADIIKSRQSSAESAGGQEPTEGAAAVATADASAGAQRMDVRNVVYHEQQRS